MAIRKVKQSQELKSCILVLGTNDASVAVMSGLAGALGCEIPASLAGIGLGAISPRIRAFNEELLSSAGTSSEDFTSFHGAWMDSPYAPDFFNRAVALLDEEFGRAPLFVLSDPAISRLVPFWAAALERFGCAVHAAIVVGDEGVADDPGRNGPLAEMIALRQMLDGEVETRGMARVFVTPEQLAQQWAEVAERTRKAFRLSWPKAADTAEFDVADLLEQYRRETSPPAGPGTDIRNAWLGQTYGVLSGWARTGEKADGQAALDRIRAEFDVASMAFARVVRAAGRRREQTALKSRVNGLRPSPRQAVANGSDELESVKAALLEQRRNATLLDAQMEQQIEAREAVEAQLLDAQAEIAASRSRRKEMARVIGNREAKIARLNEELAARYDELAKLQRLMVRSNPLWAAKAAVRKINRSVRRPS